ncbi:MAG: hypothetical protein DRP47_03550, partial [Candidatus Zixiibacteriota bacterium]
MNKYRFFLSLIVLLIAFSSSVVASDIVKEFRTVFSSCPPDPVGTFDNFHVFATDSIVGQTSGYTFSFVMARADFRKMNKGGFAFSFPEGYDLSAVTAGTLTHSSNVVDYRVKSVETSGSLIVVTLKRTAYDPSEQDDTTISVSLYVEVLTNPTVTGDYMFGGLAFKRTGSIIAGPAISKQLEILPGPPATIEVFPSNDFVLKAGESVTFDAIIQDSYGNFVLSSDAVWILDESSDPIGYFSGATLHVTTVGTGRAEVRINDLICLSGEIIVHPGNLSRIDMALYPMQIVGHPLISEARLILLDAYDNLKTDYDLVANPITLSTDIGNLTPAIIKDAALLLNGSINLNTVGVVYDGPTAVTAIQAQTLDGITSPSVTISFSGYDILEILDADSQPLQSVFPQAGAFINVVVTNNGFLTPTIAPVIDVALEGGPVVSTSFNPSAGGRVDTVALVLTGPVTATDHDLLTVTLEAKFEIGGETYTTINQTEQVVTVLEPVEVSTVAGSFHPDSLYPGAQVALEMEIVTSGHPEFVPNAWIRIAITDDEGETESVLLDSFFGFHNIFGSIISYENLLTEVPSSDLITTGWYDVVLDYAVLSEEGAYIINHKVIDSVYVLPVVEVSYVEGSFGPGFVYAGREASFGFTINLNGEYSVPVNPSGAVIEIRGNDFFASTSLRFMDSQLNPGLNLVETDSVFIPSDQQGVELHFDIVFEFIIPSAISVFDFSTDFNTEAVEVTAAPVVKIIDVEMLAPNAPWVNTGQGFQVRALVANLSGSVVGPFNMALTSDGESVFDSILYVESINPDDTAELFFDVVASDQPTPAEVFTVDVESVNVGAENPIDDKTKAFIEAPAHLALDYHLTGVVNGVIDTNQSFSLTVELINQGQASTSVGEFLLSSGVFDFLGDGGLTDTITVGQEIKFNFISPSFDTSSEITFQLISIPTDLNSEEPAEINSISFSVEITVAQIDAELLADASITGSNLVLPGREKELFCLTLSNQGTSEYAAVSLDEIS